MKGWPSVSPPQEHAQPVYVPAASLTARQGKTNEHLTAWDYLPGPLQGGLALTRCLHPDGANCGAHYHPGASEFFFGIGDSFGVITVNGQEYPMARGDFMWVPAGCRHDVRGADPKGEFDMICLQVEDLGRESNPLAGATIPAG